MVLVREKKKRSGGAYIGVWTYHPWARATTSIPLKTNVEWQAYPHTRAWIKNACETDGGYGWRGIGKGVSTE